MPAPTIITYHIDPNMGKDGAACVRWALTKWEKWLRGRVTFLPGLKAQSSWRFEMRNHPNYPDKIAKCIHTGTLQADLIFDPREPWARTTLQRAFGKGDCLRTYATHEIGHALGLNHTDNPDCIMFHQPKYTWINQEVLDSVAV